MDFARTLTCAVFKLDGPDDINSVIMTAEKQQCRVDGTGRGTWNGHPPVPDARASFLSVVLCQTGGATILESRACSWYLVEPK